MAHALPSEHAPCQENDPAALYTRNPELLLSTHRWSPSSFPCLSSSSVADFDNKNYVEGFSGHSSWFYSNQLAGTRLGWHLSDLNCEPRLFTFDGNSNNSTSLFSLDNSTNVVNRLTVDSQVLSGNLSHAKPSSSDFMCRSMDNGVWQRMTNPAVSYTSGTLGSVLPSSTDPLVDVESARNREIVECAKIQEPSGRLGNNNSMSRVSPPCPESCVITRAQLPSNTHSLSWNQLDGSKRTHLTTGLLNIDHSNDHGADLEDSSCVAQFFSESGLLERVETFAFLSSCNQSMCSGGGARFHLPSEALQCQNLSCAKKFIQASCPLPQTSPEAGSNVKVIIDHPTCENANTVGNVYNNVVNIASKNDEINKRCRSKCTSLQESDEIIRMQDAGPKIAAPGIINNNEVMFSPEKKRQRQFSEDTRLHSPSLSQINSKNKTESEDANSTRHEYLKGSKSESEQKNPKADRSSSENSGNFSPISTKGNVKLPEPPPKLDYIHVRARRGQATDSHSLAERVRREKISERMKFLQDLVPGCSKVTGKAMMLDEIINYVQSLQSQVEFLSMKLAAVNPKRELNCDTLIIKEFHDSQQNAHRLGLPSQLYLRPMNNASESVLKRMSNSSDVPADAFRNSGSQASGAWECELQGSVQLGFGPG